MSKQPESRAVSRRTLMKGAAWSVPVVAAAVAAPLAAASGSGAPQVFSSWGTTWGSVSCPRKTSCTNGVYTWNIDNTSGSGLSYHGVLFPNAQVGQVYSNVINIYWLPYSTATVGPASGYNSTQGIGTTNGTWTTPAMLQSTYGTITGPNGVTYYPWVTSYQGSVTVASIDSNGVFHLTPDYAFSLTSTHCSGSGDLWVSHAYTYSLNGTQMSNCAGTYNNNYCGGSGNYPSTSDGSSTWRNNGWIGPLDYAETCGGNGPLMQQDVVESPTATKTKTFVI